MSHAPDRHDPLAADPEMNDHAEWHEPTTGPVPEVAAAPELAAEPEAAAEPVTQMLQAVPDETPAPQEPDTNADLAAMVAARIEEVSQQATAQQDANANIDKAFGVELDGDIAAARTSCAAYADRWVQLIHENCDRASGQIAEKCAQHGVKVAA